MVVPIGRFQTFKWEMVGNHHFHPLENGWLWSSQQYITQIFWPTARRLGTSPTIDLSLPVVAMLIPPWRNRPNWRSAEEGKRRQLLRRLEGQKGSQTAGSYLRDLKGFDWMGGGDLSHGECVITKKKHTNFQKCQTLNPMLVCLVFFREGSNKIK